MPMFRVMVAVLVSLALSCGPAAARTLDQPPAYIKKEGAFVVWPARAVSLLGLAVGAVVASPLALISAPIGLAAGDPLGYAVVPSSLAANALGEVGYHVGGAVPWAVKKTLYDGPLLLAATIKGEAPSGLVAQVDPPPALTPTDLQYLESTPTEARTAVIPAREYSLAVPPPRQPTSLMLKRQLSPFKLPPTAAASRAPLSRQSPAMPPAAAPVTPAAAAVSAAPPATAPVESDAAPASIGVPPPRPAPPPRAVEPAPPPAADIESNRPTLKKKKLKFSERFGF